MIDLENVSAGTGGFRLRRITLRIDSGEYFVLLGPSGAGKTMLLEVIAGIRAADEGTIRIGGNDVTATPPEHRGTALVYQDYSLFPHMTVAENVAYGMKFRGGSRTDAGGEVDRLLSRFGISALRDRYPGSLSGGEQQRVALARALAVQPAVLLLDEPFASLDPRTREDCIRVMQDLKDTGTMTIIQVSHARDEAYALADRAAVLIGGKLMQIGTACDIFRYPVSRPVAEFAGMENLFCGYVVSADENSSQVNLGPVTLQVAGRLRPGLRVTIAIPAECIILDAAGNGPRDPGQVVIRGRIDRITPAYDHVNIGLYGSLPLTARVWQSASAPTGYHTGMEVHACIRSPDIRVIPEE